MGNTYIFKGEPPYNHQIETFKFLLKHPYRMVLNEQGTGKTRSLVCAAEMLHSLNKSRRGLYVCPDAVRETVGREIAKWTNLSAVVLSGSSDKRIKTLQETDAYFYIINYESVALILEDLLDKEFDLIICDESTRVKNHVSQRSKATQKIAKTCTYKWLSTGTPMPNNPLDIFGQFQVLDPRIFGGSKQFKRKYLVYSIDNGIPVVVGEKNMPDLRRMFGKYSIRYLKKDCLDLPDKIWVDTFVSLEGEQERVYQELAEQYVSELPSGECAEVTNVMTKCMRLQQVASGFYGSDDEVEWLGVNPKLAALKERLEEIDLEKNKVIVWCWYRPSIISLLEEFKEYNPAAFYGGVSDKDKEIVKFNTDDSCRILIGNSRVGIGCTLNVARYAIYYELPYFDTESMLQSQDRNHRIGQTEKCTYYRIIADNSIDVSILRNLEGKFQLAAYLTRDDTKNIITGMV